jgi:ABC-type multidrug transport system fused ATPase/permease subunit
MAPGLSTVRDADLILVMDHGRIVELGNHQQLVAGPGLYPEPYRAQSAGREKRREQRRERPGYVREPEL